MAQQSNKRTRILILAVIAVVLFFVGSALLLLDLANQGLIWRFFWSQTGEESPLAQTRGMMELAANPLRTDLNTQPDVPIAYTHEVPFGINTFLHEEVEIPKIHEQLRMISEAGFTWLRQEFPWEDIEVDGRGQYTDTRQDYDGDGIPDTIDAWEKYDRIVDLVDEYGLQLIVRLSNPPAWSRAQSPEEIGAFAPPDDIQDFANFASTVAERYRDDVTYFQIWNEPNIYPEWGNQFIDPAGYVELLCSAYDAVKSANPEAVVISGALAPTISLDGYSGYNDVIFLQNMYDLGAKDCFDILAVNGYGLFSGPTDQRMRVTNINYGHHQYIRDVMVANGDENKPIWISEASWNPVPDESERADVADRYRFGQVTEEQAGRYMPVAYQRAQEEWPWIGVINYWFFTRRTIEEANQSFYYFRMAEADYSPEKPTFTPLPVYSEMQDYIQETTENPILYAGTHQAEKWSIELPESAVVVPVEGAEFGTAVRTPRSAEFTVKGTHVFVRFRDAPYGLKIDMDGQISGDVVFDRNADGWQRELIHSGTSAGPYTIKIDGIDPFLIDSITIYDRSNEIILPIILVGISLTIYVLLLLGHAIWVRFSG